MATRKWNLYAKANTVTVELQRARVEKRIDEYTHQLSVVKRALPVIAQYEGKKISGHIANAVQKAFGEGWKAELDRNFGAYHLGIWEASNYNAKVSMLIGYRSPGGRFTPDIVNMENITEHNQCYLLNEGRIERLKAGLPHITGMVAKRDKALVLLAEIHDIAEKYEMDYDFDLEN